MSSLAGSISKMFSGTLVSRILGQVRLIVIVAALGTTAQADAFMVANTLPNTIYNLIAGGVLNAILVPQIVRAMKRDDGEAYTDRLLTVAGVLLLGATLVLTAGAALLVTLYASQMAPQWFALAVAFAFWCIPQVFFYGLYTLLGNVLNARSSFGPYMWAPVVNNVVAIAGLVGYIWLYGTAASGSGSDPADWDSGRIAMVGGFATLGVVAQALVLIIPLHRSGFRFRPRWGLRGSGLGSASRMAMWTFGALAVGQLGFLMLTNVASAANGAAESVDAFVPTNTAYSSAFSIYMLPQSLITTSLVTALFTRMSAHAAVNDGAAVREDMSFGMRVVGVFTVFAAAALAVLAVPVVQAVIPTASPEAAVGFAAVLAALSLGIPAQGIWTIDQRVSYAYEDARTLFRIQIPMAVLIVVGGFLSFLAPPQWWVPIVSGASALSLYVGAVVGYLALRTKLPSLDGSRVLRTYLRLTLAVIPAAAAGWTSLHFWGPVSGESAGMGSFATALLKVLAIGTLMAAIYVVLLRRLEVDELDEILDPVRRLLRRRRAPASAPSSAAPNMDGGGGVDGEDPDVRAVAGSLIAGRFRLDSEQGTTASGATVWVGRDRVLDRAVTVLVDGTESADDVLDAARRASLIDDNRFARIVDTGRDVNGAVFVVSELPEGTPLTDLAGHLTPQSARAVIGETAAALEAARRRGVHHGALEPGRVLVTPDGNVVITGLGYLAVADGMDEQHPDPVEASLARSRTDARELARLHGFLISGSVPEDVDERSNAGEVMRSLAPWEEITLPSGPTPPRAHPLWRRVRDDGASLRDPSAGAGGDASAGASADATGLAAAAAAAGAAAAWGAAEAAAATAPPPPPPVDTSTWTLRRGDRLSDPPPGFDDLLSATSPEPAGRVAHAASLPAPWSVLLPGQPSAGSPEEQPTEEAPTEEAPPGEEPTGEPRATPASPTSATTPASPEEGPDAVALTATPDSAGAPDAGAGRRARLAATGAVLTGAAAAAAARARSASASLTERMAERRARAEEAREAARAADEATGDVGAAGEPEPDVDAAPVDASRRGTVLTAAAAAASEKVQAGGTQLRQQATRAREASVRAAGTSMRKLDTFVSRHDLHVPGELETEDNAALPFSERRLDPGPFVIMLMVIAVAAATVFSVLNLLSVGGIGDSSETPAEVVPTAEATPTAPTTAAPTEPAASTAAPVISSIGVLDPQGDGAENPDLTPRALDGDTETFWRSRSYVNPQYGMKVGIGLDLVLAERAVVTEVELTLHGEGGHVQVKADPGNAVDGEVIAEADMGRTTVIPLPEGTELSNVVLWFTALPVADSDGKNRVEMLEVAVR